MKRSFIIFFLCGFLAFGCGKQEGKWLNQEPSTVLLKDATWANPDLVVSVLANLYDRIPEYQELENFAAFADFDEAFPSANGDYFRVKNPTFDFSWVAYWDYGYVRDINLFITDLKDRGGELSEEDRNRFLAEAQFLRANVYFSLVERMGGVPLILDTLLYAFNGDASHLQFARSSEAEIYDFVIKELDSAAQYLPQEPGLKDRATWGAALAMKSRAALYAGSIAKYGNSTPSVTLPDHIVGIPQDKAENYYQIALDAANTLIESGEYALYEKDENDLSNNFANIFLDKNNNPEVIFAKNYLLGSRTTQFTVQNQPHSSTEEGSWSGVVNPSLNLVQSYEKLDNTFAPFEIKDASGEYIKYDQIGDLFKDRDARLAGTVILPGSQFRSTNVDIWAGFIQPDGSIISGSQYGQTGSLPGQTGSFKLVGEDGPIDQLEHGAQTGFYIRKFNDPTPGAGQIGSGSEVWWIRYRYSEVLLNAAEASFELGDLDSAMNLLNQVRKRAGLTTPLDASEITFDRIVHERRVELAFEGHEFWDMKRWRIAHKVWNGESINADKIIENIGRADKNQSMVFGLWPYQIYNPGKSDDGKWIFKIVKPSEVNVAHQFRMGNYYSRIPDGTVSNNPKLVQNPNQ